MLEALPGEIIEQIFLHSLNLNLARASPFLSRALSREHMYRTLILLAFWEDTPALPGSAAIDQMMVGPLEYIPLSLEERSHLQEDVFKCKWLTLERVRDLVPTMQILTIHRHWINAGIKVNEDQQGDFEKFLARKIDTPRVFHGQGPSLDRLTGMLTQAYGETFKRLCPLATKDGLHPYELNMMPMVQTELVCTNMSTVVNFPALNIVRFPDHLLRGRKEGFLPEDVAFLEILRMTSYNWTEGTLRGINTKINRKALNQGIQNAIRTQNLSAMICLLKIDEFIFRCETRMEGQSLTHIIPEEHFLAVTRTGRDNPQLNLAFFEALVRASAESVPTHSSEMTEWIVWNRNLARSHPSNRMNGKFADWLSNWLMRLPEHMMKLHYKLAFPLFVYGGLGNGDLEGTTFYQEVLYPNRKAYGNWLPESSFRVEDYWLKKFGPLPPP